jgi:uncharacterized damage-inducible protein DinB
MASFFDDLLNRFQEIHTDLGKAIQGLPPEALDWTAGEQFNTIAVLVVHLLGAERFWIGDVALGEPSGRVRDEEFEVHGLTVVDLEERLSAEEAYLRRVLPRFSLRDLAEMRTSSRSGDQFTVGWCLAHALEHSALHLGHVQLTRQLWEQTRGKIVS